MERESSIGNQRDSGLILSDGSYGTLVHVRPPRSLAKRRCSDAQGDIAKFQASFKGALKGCYKTGLELMT